MRFLRLMMVVASVLLTAAYTFAQQPPPPCAVTQAPELRGFQLGMTVPEVRKMVEDPSLFDARISAVNAVKTRAVRISGAELKGENGEGVDDVDLTFADERLAIIRVTYNSAMRWDNSQDFFKRVSESMGLPVPSGTESQRGTRRGNERYIVECVGFNATLAYSFGVSPNVTLANSAAQKVVKERRAKEGEGDVRVINITPPGRPPKQPPPR
jgi:hypothetical protein